VKFYNNINNIIGGKKVMLKKHLTVLLLLVMAVGALAQSIPSGTARYEALGYNPFIMDAATDINRNPAWGGMYRNYTFGDIGRSSIAPEAPYLELSGQYAGVNFGLGKNFAAGMILNRNEGQIFSGYLRAYYEGRGISAPIVPFEGLISYTAANKKFHIGLAPYIAMWSVDSTAGAVDLKKSSMIFGGTIGVVSMMKNGWVEGNVDVRLNKYKYELTDTVPSASLTDEASGGFELNAVIRGWFTVHKPGKINLVPYARFSMFSWKPDVTPAPLAITEQKYLDIRGGVGINMPVLDDGMLAGGLSVGFNRDEYTTGPDTSGNKAVITYTHFILPQFNFGLEWSFTEWLTGRVGYSRFVDSYNTKQEITAGNVTSTTELTKLEASNPEQTVTLGLGLHFGRFSFDGLIGEQFFQQGPNVLSGHTNDLYGVISASYNFNK
jgi:hypothetical protein